MPSLGTSYGKLPLTPFPTEGILKGANGPLEQFFGHFLFAQKVTQGAQRSCE